MQYFKQKQYNLKNPVKKWIILQNFIKMLISHLEFVKNNK